MAKKALGLSLIVSFWASLALASWSEPVRISEPGGCSHPQILAIGDTLHVVYDNGRGGDKISYVRSTDGGESWSQYQVISDTSGNIQSMFPWIMQYQGRLMVLCFSFGLYGVFDNNVAYIFSNDYGITWQAPEYIFNQNWERPLPIVASSADSIVNIVMGTAINDSGYEFSIRSTNFGQSWSAPQYLFNAMETWNSDLVEAGALVHLVWSGRYDLNHSIEIYYTSSTDYGATWNPNTALSDTDQYHSQLPAIAVDEAGNPIITWMDFKYAPPGFTGDIFLRQSPDSGISWNPTNEIIYNHKAFQSDVAVKGDTIHVIWEDETPSMVNTGIQYIRSTNNGSSWGEITRLDQTSDDSRSPALALSNGCVYAVWGDTRYSPDTSGLFFTRWQAEPDEVYHDTGRNLPEMISISVCPNPFNASVTLNYSCAEGGDIKIINSLGQLLKDFKVDASSQGRLVWDGKDLAGKSVASGVYIVRFFSRGQVKTLRLVCVK